MNRISSLDIGYETGDLSVYPAEIDSKDTLYEAKNNAETRLSNTLSYNGKVLVVGDTTGFPDKGLLRVGKELGEPGAPELVYYSQKTSTTFRQLVRGYAGSRQNQWNKGNIVAVPVAAEMHNSKKDAVLNIQDNLGIIEAPRTVPEDDGPLHGILKEIENRFLAPRPFFRASYLSGPPPLAVRFQNFTSGDPVRFLWDFGDDTQSIEESPLHTYHSEGLYTVTLNIINSTGGQGVATKFNYIEVNEDERIPFFYTTPLVGTAGSTEFEFVDQSDGDIIQRFWIFDDGSNVNVDDPNLHTITHVYDTPGTYEPTLLVIFASQRIKRVFLNDRITVE